VSGVRAAAAWWAFVLRYEARELWRALPGPWWVKVLLLAVCLACPGPWDELAVIMITAAFRKRRARRELAAQIRA
jgi:hypothetical protein